jgi:hypothetical protein
MREVTGGLRLRKAIDMITLRLTVAPTHIAAFTIVCEGSAVSSGS